MFNKERYLQALPYSSTIRKDIDRENSYNLHREATSQLRDNPVVEVIDSFSQLYHTNTARGYPNETVYFDYDSPHHPSNRSVGSLEGEWSGNERTKNFKMVMRNSGLDALYRSSCFYPSEMACVLAGKFNKLFLGHPVIFETTSDTALSDRYWRDNPYKPTLKRTGLYAASYSLEVFDDYLGAELLGDSKFYNYLSRIGFCMSFLRKSTTKHKEILMLATHKKLGRIYKYPVRDKDFSSMMLGQEWTQEERLMVEMAGYKDEIWLDTPEIFHIMRIPTLTDQEIESCIIKYQF